MTSWHLCRPEQTYDINRRDRPGDTGDHQWHSAMLPLLLLPPVWRRSQEQSGRVAELRWCMIHTHYASEAGNADEKHRHGRCGVCVRCVVSIRSPISLATEQKTSKDWSEQKAEHFIYECQKVGKQPKTWKQSVKNGMVGRHFLLYSAVS